jgi:sugar/nucleoside kinase (ribokinase family)
MIDYVIYGKIILDDIRLLTGEIVFGKLGGGGPQGAYGARLWDKSVGILTRSGVDIDTKPREMLEKMGIDLKGWVKFENHPTPRFLMSYDDNEYMVIDEDLEEKWKIFNEKLDLLLKEELPIPESYKNPKVIHMITEYPHEPMAHEALKMKEKGSIYSLEPIIDHRKWTNKAEMMAYIPKVDIVTPDWPSASQIAESDDPMQVLKYWSRLGPSLVAIRHGIQGSYVWDKIQDRMWHIPIVKVNAIDPTGCGNSYGGGLCVGWEKTQDAKLAGCYGTVSASYLAKSIGIPQVTPESEVEAKDTLNKLIDQVREM